MQYPVQDPYQYRDPGARYGAQYQQENNLPHHPANAGHENASGAPPRHFTFDNYDANYDPRYGAADMTNAQQYGAPTSPRSPNVPEVQPAQGYPNHAQYQGPVQHPSYDQHPSPAQYQGPVQQQSPAQYQGPVQQQSYDQYPSPVQHQNPPQFQGPVKHQSYDQYPSPVQHPSYVQYPSPYQYDADPEFRGHGPAPYSGRYDLDRYTSPSRDIVDYRQPEYIPERKHPKENHYAGYHEQNRYSGYSENRRDKHYVDYDRGYSSADEYAYRPQGRHESSKRQHPSRKHSNEYAKYEIPPPDYTMNRYDDRYRMGDLARALPPVPKSGRAVHKSNSYGRSADDRGIKYHNSSAGYTKYGSPDFDYKGFQKRTSQMKRLNQIAIEQARPPAQSHPRARHERPHPNYDDGRYRAQYSRY